MSATAEELQRRRLLNLLGALATAAEGRLWGRLEREEGVSSSAAATLVTLRTFEDRDISIGGLAAVVGLSHSATVRLVDRLSNAGLLARWPGRDGREVTLKLSPTGRAMADRVLGAREDVIAEMVGPLPASAIVSLSALLEGLLGQMTGSRRDARWICRVCDHGLCHRSGGCPVDDAATKLGE
jgi:DNA-binding MarR family transcriptional regulator